MCGLHIVEHDENKGCKTTLQFAAHSEGSTRGTLGTEVLLEKHPNAADANAAFKRLLSNVFLPAGYPHSVSPDYLQYQVWNAAQACCSSLANLLASRAVLEGFGVGDQSASATDAILITVVQDVVSRLTSVCPHLYRYEINDINSDHLRILAGHLSVP